MWHYESGDASWLLMSGMMTFTSVLTGAVVVAIVLASRRGDSGASGPRRVLDERYARGEIAHDEYEERRRRLGSARRG
jgi:uncharacterized membrane protein